MQDISLYTIIAVAFMSSFSHCVGMCSGFLGLQALFFKGKSKSKILMLSMLFRGELLKFIESEKALKFIVKMAKTSVQKRNLANFLLLGFLNGLLPCGVVYYFLALGILSANAADSSLIMFIFGLCTLPAMLLASFVFGLLREKFKEIMFKLSACIMILNGLYLSFLGYRANA